MLDIVFREDEYRVRRGYAALKVNILKKMKYGTETGERYRPHDACRPGLGLPVRGFVLRVNADALYWTASKPAYDALRPLPRKSVLGQYFL
jgi:hypothetical protein